jgi:fluoroquinolone transport system ATP-binding protein
MQDATELCDKVAFIVEGEIKALDTPHNLIMRKGAASVKYTFYDGTERSADCLLSKTAEDTRLIELLKNNRIQSIHSSEPTLSDIFMEVTGRTLK